MKKQIILVLMCCALFLSACGENKKPDNVSDEMYENAVYVIKAVDLYINGEATQEETYKKVNSIKLGDFSDHTGNNGHDGLVYAKVYSLQGEMEKGNVSKIKEMRNELAKEVGYKD